MWIVEGCLGLSQPQASMLLRRDLVGFFVEGGLLGRRLDWTEVLLIGERTGEQNLKEL